MAVVDSAAVIELDRLADSFNHTNFYVHDIKREFQDRVKEDLTQVPDSAFAQNPNNPTYIEEDLAIQKDYCSKLKFKYIEHTAKDKFLKIILSEDPDVISPEDNIALDENNKVQKAVLAESKAKLASTYSRITEVTKEIETTHNKVKADVDEGSRLLKEIREMKLELARLAVSNPPETRVTVPEAERILDEQVNEIQTLETTLRNLYAQIERTEVDVTQSMEDVKKLGPQRIKMEAAAKEAVKSQEGKGEVARLCAWHAAAIQLYKSAFSIKSLSAFSENELRLEYGPPVPFTLSIVFNPITQRLADAKILKSTIDIQEIVTLAITADDVPLLVREVRTKMLAPTVVRSS